MEPNQRKNPRLIVKTSLTIEFPGESPLIKPHYLSDEDYDDDPDKTIQQLELLEKLIASRALKLDIAISGLYQQSDILKRIQKLQSQSRNVAISGPYQQSDILKRIQKLQSQSRNE